MMMMLSGGCPDLKLTAALLTNGPVQIDICGKELNARYDLITTTNLNPTAVWAWLQEIPYPTNTLIVSTNTEYRFFRLKKVPDADGDGQRDVWEWGGSVPGGITVDDDDDNDGIPDSIESTAGSTTTDPASLPPPSLYVSTTGPASGADGSLDLPFRDIQTALNLATNFSVVLVKAGTYAGVSNRNLSFSGKPLVLVSEKGPAETTINCGGSNNYAFAFTSTNEDYRAQVIGFSVTNTPYTGTSALICAGGSAPTLVNCDFKLCNAGVVNVTNASPLLINCAFRNNATFAVNRYGTAIYATGSNSLVRLSHGLIVDNERLSGRGQVYATAGATIAMHNSIVWSVGGYTNMGPDILTSGGTVTATYCDLRTNTAGAGNISLHPLFESTGFGGTYRLTNNSPCIDQGVAESFPGFSLFTRFDFDGEQRLDHRSFANTYSTADIGPDEYVYRLQFPLNGGFSEVDEASGVSFLGTNSTGPVIAIVDDEDRASFHSYQLNSNATAIVSSTANSVLEAGTDEVADLEGVTFDPATRQLYLVTSQTKRNRYRDVDNIATDPVVDPPSNDYDRRRTKTIQVQVNSNLTSIAATKYFYTSESNGLPTSVGYDATNGLAAYIRQALLTNNALGDRTITNRVLIARNTANKFGTPVNGVSYSSGAFLPYASGGSATTAGESLGEFSGTSGVLTNSGLTSNTWYYYKIWAVDAQTNYLPGLVSDARLNGVPKLFVNEFLASPATGNDWIEIFNPAFVPVNMGGLRIANASQSFYPIPAGTNIPARGHLRFFAVQGLSNGLFVPFSLNPGVAGDRIYLRMSDSITPIDDYRFGEQFTGVTEGRAWDGGPFGFKGIGQIAEGAKFITGSSFPPSEQAANHPAQHKFFRAVPDVRGTTNYLEWSDVGALPAVSLYSPKQHDFHSINVEDIAFRSTNEMILGLRSPLSNRTNGNAYYFVVTNVSAFAPGTNNWTGAPQGLVGPFEMNLGGLGIRSIKWCPNGLTNSNDDTVQRYLIVAGNANGGPLVRENLKQKFSLYSWTGDATNTPVKLLDDLKGYAVRPEGIDIMSVGGEWRVLFVEDRYQATGYATRNALHWPVSILGIVP